MSATFKAIVAFIGLIVVWWSMAELALSSDAINAGVRDVIARAPFPDDDIIFFDHFETYCCQDFTNAFAFSLFVTTFSSMPIRLLALILYRRKAALRRWPAFQSFALAALVLQGASLILNLWLAMLWLATPTEYRTPLDWIFAGGVVVGLAAIPSWYRLVNAGYSAPVTEVQVAR